MTFCALRLACVKESTEVLYIWFFPGPQMRMSFGMKSSDFAFQSVKPYLPIHELKTFDSKESIWSVF